MYSVNKSFCHFSLHCQASSDEGNVKSWSQGSKVGVWWDGIFRRKRCIEGAFIMFQVKTEMFSPLLLSHLLDCSHTALALRWGYLCCEEKGWLMPQCVAWHQELWSACESPCGSRSSYGVLVSHQWVMHYKGCWVHLVLPKGVGSCLHCLLHTTFIWEPVRQCMHKVIRCLWLLLHFYHCASSW